MKKLLAYLLVVGLFVSVFASPSFAAVSGLCPADAGSIICDLTVPGLIKGSIQFILVTAFVLSFAFLVFGGIKWILSGGDKAGTEGAKGTITAALIGLVVVLVAWALLNLVSNLFGLSTNIDTLNTIKIPTK
jgi:hypothetical protein